MRTGSRERVLFRERTEKCLNGRVPVAHVWTCSVPDAGQLNNNRTKFHMETPTAPELWVIP